MRGIIMATLQIKTICIESEPINEAEYDDNTGIFTGDNAENWNNLIELSGFSGNWVASFKNSIYGESFEIL